LCFGGVLQSAQPHIPERFKERAQLGQTFRSSNVEAPGSFAPFKHKAGVFEHPKVLRYGRSSDVEARGNLARREFS
jgi:hypothetical protein